jgi:hypothetical protein
MENNQMLKLCRGSFVLAVQLRLAIPKLLHVEKIKEWDMRNSLHQKITQKSCNFLTRRENMKHSEGLEKSKMALQA